MRTVYGKLITLLFITIALLLFFLPMRSGMEDHLYAYPRNLRMNRGDSYDITYLLDSDHAQAITYNSVDESVAVVSARGKVSAVGPGSTDIHLNAENGARTTVHVEVAGTPTTQLALNTSSLRMEKGQVTGLSVSFNDGADDTRVEWHSEDPTIAHVDATGHVTALRGGSTSVYAVSPSGLRADADVFVHVSGDAMRISPEALTVGTGASLKLGATYFPEDTTDDISRWVSSDKNLLTVDADGTIHALGVGKPVLTAYSSEGLTASAVIDVEPSADSFDLSPSAVTIERGSAIDLEPRFFTADGNIDIEASSHYIEWQSDSPEVASVVDGHVLGLKSGTANITATADGMTASCALSVQVLVHEIALNQSEIWLLREDSAMPIQLTAQIVPADPDDPSITWHTSNDLVANVDENGLVTMTGSYGSAVITARSSSGAEAHFTVNIVVRLPDEDEVLTEMQNPDAVAQVNAPTQRIYGGFSYDAEDAAMSGKPAEELTFDVN